jgi:hypothetical protein
VIADNGKPALDQRYRMSSQNSRLVKKQRSELYDGIWTRRLTACLDTSSVCHPQTRRFELAGGCHVLCRELTSPLIGTGYLGMSGLQPAAYD